MLPRAPTALETTLRDGMARVAVGREAVLAFLARFDPNTDPDADRLTPLPLVVLAIGMLLNAWMFLRWKYQPMQDFGLHEAVAAVVADYGRPHSIYTAMYAPFDHLAGNSLMAQLDGYFGRIVGVTTAMRVGMLVYVLGFPLATLYAVRFFGRSPWGAVLAVPLTYNMIYVAGFMTVMFAIPFAILAVVFFFQMLETPTRARVAWGAATLAVLFLIHVHVFLWTGFLLFLLTIGFVVREIARAGLSPRERATAVGLRAAAAFGAVAPALALFARWYGKTFEHQVAGHPEFATAGWSEHFGATFWGVRGMIERLPAPLGLYGVQSKVEFDDLLWLLLAVTVAVAVSRMHKYRRPPILELAFGLTAISYFVLPENLKGHDVVASRQLSIAEWLLPALASPVPARVSRVGRWAVVGLILAFATLTLHRWHEHLVKFETEEVAGLDEVLAAAPPRLRIHYVKLDMGSAYFIWLPFAHVEKVYMGDGFGSSDDTPGALVTSFIQFREGVDMHRDIEHSPNWPANMELWRNFDLVLTRRWHPTPAMKALAHAHGELLKKQGDWELWRSKEATPMPVAP